MYLKILELTKLTGHRLAADKSNCIGSVHRLANSLTPIPAFSAMSEAISNDGIGMEYKQDYY